MPRVQHTNTPAHWEEAVREAADLLRAGEAVVLPTETVYGLAANALDTRAVERIFEIKGRPARNPIIVHVAGLEMARRCAADWPETAEKLAKAFWPGPLTLVLRKSARIPDIVTAGGDTVGIRWPAHQLFQAIIERCGFPLAAPSANLSGQLSATSASHAQRALDERVALIVDGGSAEIGIESTVVDLCVSPARVLRPGMIHAESLDAVLGCLAAEEHYEQDVLRSPGLLLKHYAPQARLMIWDGSSKSLASAFAETGLPPNRVHLLARGTAPPGVHVGHVCVMPRDPSAFARAFYAELHRADETGAALIVVEAVPDTPPWRAIADRIRRAAAQ